MTPTSMACVSPNQCALYLVTFLRHSASNNGVTLKSASGSLVTLIRDIENGIIRKLGYGLLFAFHSNHGRIFSRFDTIHERDGQTPIQTDIQPTHDGIGRVYAQHCAAKTTKSCDCASGAENVVFLGRQCFSVAAIISRSFARGQHNFINTMTEILCHSRTDQLMYYFLLVVLNCKSSTSIAITASRYISYTKKRRYKETQLIKINTLARKLMFFFSNC